MSDSSPYILTAVIPALCGFAGAIVGGWVTYFAYEKTRKRKSIYEVADIFGEAAREWTHKKFEPGLPDFVKWHNDSIDHLSASVDYLDRNHGGLRDKIWPLWVAYHGADPGKVIDYNSYYNPEIRENAYWLNCLYCIADILRDS